MCHGRQLRPRLHWQDWDRSSYSSQCSWASQVFRDNKGTLIELPETKIKNKRLGLLYRRVPGVDIQNRNLCRQDAVKRGVYMLVVYIERGICPLLDAACYAQSQT